MHCVHQSLQSRNETALDLLYLKTETIKDIINDIKYDLSSYHLVDILNHGKVIVLLSYKSGNVNYFWPFNEVTTSLYVKIRFKNYQHYYAMVDYIHYVQLE